MSEEALEERIRRLEESLASAQSSKKDVWDIFNIVASLAIPASIAFSGYYFSQAMKDAEIESNENLAARQENISLINSKIGQASLIATFIEHLTSDDDQRKRIAIKGVLIALPDRGPEIVSIISVTDSSEEIKQFAMTTLDSRREDLIVNAFSEDKGTRIAATTELVRGWNNDQQLVPQLIKYAENNVTRKSGVINALVVLDSVDPDIVKAYGSELESLLDQAAQNGPQTASLVEAIKEKVSR